MLAMEVSIFASLVYVVEKDDTRGPGSFENIPAAMYWGMVTITTVGYGDMYPVTGLGRFLGCLTMFTGLIVIACVVIMFGSNFEKAHDRFHDKKQVFRQRYTDRRS